jgi:hypothetical protein
MLNSLDPDYSQQCFVFSACSYFYSLPKPVCADQDFIV